ncbi:c-type cytochrome [Nordella sp. HKS 07]|uniref:c-type cytochrome n=1 Tax=Nordella sp. HKS 07 TaxID=2712222 RepID=UPI001FEDD732
MIAALIGAAIITGLGVAYFNYELPRLRTAEQIALGRSVYMANCAQCHGAQLEGQPD